PAALAAAVNGIARAVGAASPANSMGHAHENGKSIGNGTPGHASGTSAPSGAAPVNGNGNGHGTAAARLT
nr:hypothetical protein [Actinomycetota bacterium]